MLLAIIGIIAIVFGFSIYLSVRELWRDIREQKERTGKQENGEMN